MVYALDAAVHRHAQIHGYIDEGDVRLAALGGKLLPNSFFEGARKVESGNQHAEVVWVQIPV